MKNYNLVWKLNLQSMNMITKTITKIICLRYRIFDTNLKDMDEIEYCWTDIKKKIDKD